MCVRCAIITSTTQFKSEWMWMLLGSSEIYVQTETNFELKRYINIKCFFARRFIETERNTHLLQLSELLLHILLRASILSTINILSNLIWDEIYFSMALVRLCVFRMTRMVRWWTEHNQFVLYKTSIFCNSMTESMDMDIANEINVNDKTFWLTHIASIYIVSN